MALSVHSSWISTEIVVISLIFFMNTLIKLHDVEFYCVKSGRKLYFGCFILTHGSIKGATCKPFSKRTINSLDMKWSNVNISMWWKVCFWFEFPMNLRSACESFSWNRICQAMCIVINKTEWIKGNNNSVCHSLKKLLFECTATRAIGGRGWREDSSRVG